MLVVTTRPYGGLEGKRVRAGTQFWVQQPGTGKKPDDVPLMKVARFNQLKGQGLAIEADKAGAPLGKPERQPLERRPRTPAPKSKVEPDSKPPADASALRAQAAKRTPPPSPPVKSRPGGQTGAADASSSSQAVPQTGTSTLKLRGNRRGQKSGGSPSTTPSGSAPGQTPSTEQTPPGGGTTPGSGDSAAFG